MNQLESALVLTLRESIPWESALEISSAGTLAPIDPTAVIDARKYQRRDRELAFRDLINAAAVAEVSIRVSDVWGYSAPTPRMQGGVTSDLVNNPSQQSFYGTSVSVRHVGHTSVPYDAAQFSDKDLYGRDAVIYETLAQACSIFTAPPVVSIDMAGTIPQTSTWALAQGREIRADINTALPLNRDLFKLPDQNLADRDNQMAGYVATMAQVLKNPFAYATRIYVSVDNVDPREPEIYVFARNYFDADQSYDAGDEVFYLEDWYRALVDTDELPIVDTDWEVIDGPTERVFVAEPALSNRNRIVYNNDAKTLQWVRERTNLVHVPQIVALQVPGVAAGQTLRTLPRVPEPRDAQYWRMKASQIVPDGDAMAHESILDFTASDKVSGGYTQVSSASLTVPSSITFTLPDGLPAGDHRVTVLAKPNPVVEIAGAQNIQGTSGTLGGATFEVNPVAVTSGVEYLVVGGSGVVYAGGTYAPASLLTGLNGTTSYLRLGDSDLRQHVCYWKLSLPEGAWTVQIDYTNISGSTSGFGLRALYAAAGVETVTVIEDTVEQPFVAGNGTIVQSAKVGFDVIDTNEFQFPIYWRTGDGELHIRKLTFENDEITGGHYVMNGTLGSSTSPLDVVGMAYLPDCLAFDFTTGSIAAPSHFSINWSADADLPIQLKQVHIQSLGTYSPTPNAALFQGWRQEMVDRAVRCVQHGFVQSVHAYGTDTPRFKLADGTWDYRSTEALMSFIEVHQPRLREIASVANGNIVRGRQYEITVGPVVYDGHTYSVGQKFYGTASGGATFTGAGAVKQVGAFIKSRPGHVGRPAIVPQGLEFDLEVGVAKIAASGSNCVPVVTACEPWMVDAGIYVVQPEFWMPENT